MTTQVSPTVLTRDQQIAYWMIESILKYSTTWSEALEKVTPILAGHPILTKPMLRHPNNVLVGLINGVIEKKRVSWFWQVEWYMRTMEEHRRSTSTLPPKEEEMVRSVYGKAAQGLRAERCIMKLPQLRECHIISEEQPTVLPIAAGKQPQRQNMFYVLDTLAKLRETHCANWAAEVAAFQQRFPFEFVKTNVQEWLAYINTDELCVFDKFAKWADGVLESGICDTPEWNQKYKCLDGDCLVMCKGLELERNVI